MLDPTGSGCYQSADAPCIRALDQLPTGDGVVRYESARMDGVESEKSMRSGHSVQMKQEAIQELRRILLEHATPAEAR